MNLFGYNTVDHDDQLAPIIVKRNLLCTRFTNVYESDQ